VNPKWLCSLGFVIAVGAALAVPGQAGATDSGTSCADLAALAIPGVTVTSATLIADGAFTPESSSPRFEPTPLPAFCRVIAIATPTDDSIINFQVWIPPAEAWNGKFQGVGNQGFQGAPNYRFMSAALHAGYATASTDTGHVGGGLDFAAGHPEKIVDWAHRSIHVITEHAKLMVRAHTGRWPAYSYFNGCNTGGHQALMEAQLYPDDYDGIIAAVPANNRLNEIIGYLGVWRATHDADGNSLLSHDDLQLVTQSAVAMCDADDGVVDGVIDDPRLCSFDPASLICSGRASATCLSRQQVDAVKRVYGGVHNSRTGALIFSGWPIGSEGYGPTTREGWNGMINIPQPRRSEFFNHFVFNDPNWDWRTMDADRDVDYATETMGFVSAIDPDLSAFRDHGGKLIMYAGWVDAILPAGDVIGYFDRVVATMGPEAVEDFFRFYMVPGVAHCSGGPGTPVIDMVPALERWVEQGEVPHRVIASRVEDGETVRTRPLCPYPQVARWSGEGDTDDASNFTCESQP